MESINFKAITNFSGLEITVRDFAAIKTDLKLGDHFNDPKKYAWKPVIIQVFYLCELTNDDWLI